MSSPRRTATRRRWCRTRAGRIVVWTPPGTPAPTTLAELADPRFKRIAIANPDHAPYGKAAKQALQKAGLFDQLADKIKYGENIQATMQFARTGAVDAAIVALSLAVVADSGSYLPIDQADYDALEQELVVCGTGERGRGGAPVRQLHRLARRSRGDDALRVLAAIGEDEVKLRPETLAAQALHAIDPQTGAIIPPIHMATTYARDAAYQLIDGRDYSRDRNPTPVLAEQLLAALEGGAAAMVHAFGHGGRDVGLSRGPARPAITRSRRRSATSRCAAGSCDSRQRGRSTSTLSTRRISRPSPRRLRPTTKLVWIEDARQSDVGLDGHRRDRRARTSRRRAARDRLDVRDARPYASAGARRRSRDALGDEVSRRPLRRARGCARHREARRAVGGAVAHAPRRGCRARPARGVAAPARDADAVRARRAPEQDGIGARASPRRARRDGRLSRSAEAHPGHAIAARQMHGGFRRPAVDPRALARRAGQEVARLGAGDLARRRREPGRASRDGSKARPARPRRSCCASRSASSTRTICSTISPSAL